MRRVSVEVRGIRFVGIIWREEVIREIDFCRSKYRGVKSRIVVFVFVRAGVV